MVVRAPHREEPPPKKGRYKMLNRTLLRVGNRFDPTGGALTTILLESMYGTYLPTSAHMGPFDNPNKGPRPEEDHTARDTRVTLEVLFTLPFVGGF